MAFRFREKFLFLLVFLLVDNPIPNSPATGTLSVLNTPVDSSVAVVCSCSVILFRLAVIGRNTALPVSLSPVTLLKNRRTVIHVGLHDHLWVVNLPDASLTTKRYLFSRLPLFLSNSFFLSLICIFHILFILSFSVFPSFPQHPTRSSLPPWRSSSSSFLFFPPVSSSWVRESVPRTCQIKIEKAFSGVVSSLVFASFLRLHR